MQHKLSLHQLHLNEVKYFQESDEIRIFYYYVCMSLQSNTLFRYLRLLKIISLLINFKLVRS